MKSNSSNNTLEEKIFQLKTNLEKGTYAFILQLNDDRIIEVGKLKSIKFIKGYYVYVGSAFGPGGLTARLNHHLKISGKPHWHIDYLRKYSSIKEIWYSESNKRLEHYWADIFSKIAFQNYIIPKFGSSDCDCLTHLFYFENHPSFNDFLKIVESDKMTISKIEISKFAK